MKKKEKKITFKISDFRPLIGREIISNAGRFIVLNENQIKNKELIKGFDSMGIKVIKNTMVKEK